MIKGVLIWMFMSILTALPGNRFVQKEGVVTETDSVSDTVYMYIDENVFVFCGIEDWFEDDRVRVTFDTKGTESIEDDIILNVRYIG